jgi:hypothetical protein
VLPEDRDDLDGAAADLKPSRRWVLQALRAGGAMQYRVDLDRRQLEVLEVRYDAGPFGSGYKNRPKSAASIRVVPLAGQVAEAITRRFPPNGDPGALVFTGPGGSNGLPRGARSAMSRHGLLRVYKHALLRVADPVVSLPYTPRRVGRPTRRPADGRAAPRAAAWAHTTSGDRSGCARRAGSRWVPGGPMGCLRPA